MFETDPFWRKFSIFSQSDVRFSPGTKAIVFSVRTKSGGNALVHSRVGQSVESALIAFAAIFWLIARILTILDKKYRF